MNKDLQPVSILGAGRVGANLARAFAERGHVVTVGHRTLSTGAPAWQGPAVRHATLAEAAAASPVVFHATPGHTALELLTGLRLPLRDKVLVDVSNATVRQPNGAPGDLLYPDGSLGQRIQAALPETRVVKALNTMFFTVMTAPRSLATPAQVFLSAEDVDAKTQVRTLLASLGWPDEWILDLGGIASARATEAMILMAPHVVAAKGFKPFALTVAA
ncbi:NADPH-dependent F420 reductase [Mitsuaria sp. 7]|uniref:NADPH-dependent F420 reductase n=1 Tax=Mitsuaria sp. 7 TaxID=1658665 RepID=UPI0007DE13D8|nr:NAD(P)-binding domain-containing protein [Mitsuaria sp. 7]ANH68482.1 NADP oxidoreductase [Mitsuaria sp. 7]